ncbi:MAG: HD domain-containing protein, partial [Flavobacteriaceae bacterium]
MPHLEKTTVFNDPIYGFIKIEDPFVLQLIDHPYVQRLRRISQMGLSSLVYPGAQHTRFAHALGAYHLMVTAISVLKTKGTVISVEEEKALGYAILLHDLGHGPFSHALERALIADFSHEQIGLALMNSLNQTFGGKLNLAIEIFKGTYPRSFMNQLVASQLDMDRLDYLKRDSFYTGVAEGNINADRLI